MDDPADRDVHSPEGRDPYPEPRRGVKAVEQPEDESGDDLDDPGEADPDMPHNRGVVRGDEHVGAREDIIEHVSDEKEAWKKGRTQNLPPPPD
jgi:hypothetical protein